MAIEFALNKNRDAFIYGVRNHIIFVSYLYTSLFS